MEKVSFEYTSGKINAGQGSGKCLAFHAPHFAGLRSGEKEEFLGEAIRKEPTLGTKASMNRFPSRTNIKPVIGGEFWQSSFLLAEGEIIKIFATSTVGDNWLAPKKTASIFLRMRAEAALTRIKIGVPHGVPDSATPDWYALGRFDVLSVDEADELGVAILENARSQFSGSGYDALFKKEIIAPEIKPKDTVEMEQVGDRLMRTKRKRRSFGA